MKHPGYSDTGFYLGYRAAQFLPRPLCRGIASTLALASYYGNHEGRAALRKNLKRVTGINGSTLDRICRKNFVNFGRMLGDYFYCSGVEGESIRALLDEWHGINNLRAALDQGKGVILVTGHLGNWELGGTLLALDGWPINVVTLEEPTTELTQTRDEYRKRLGIRTIAVGKNNTFAFVEMIAALRRNEIVCMLVDRPYGETGVPVDFFGLKTGFSSAPALLWQHTGAAVIPAFVLHNQRGRYHAFAVSPIPMEPNSNLNPGPNNDRQEALSLNTQRIATVFETIIRKHPEQWFNYVPIWKNEINPPPKPAGCV